MFSIQEIKAIAEEPDMTDQEAVMLRDAAQGFAEIVCQLMRSTSTSNNRPVVAMSQNSPAAVEDELGKSPRECSA